MPQMDLSTFWIWGLVRITSSHQGKLFELLEALHSCVRVGSPWNSSSTEKQLNKPCTYAKRSSVYTSAKQYTLTLEYSPKTFRTLWLQYYSKQIWQMQYIPSTRTHKKLDASTKHNRSRSNYQRIPETPPPQQNKNTSPKRHLKTIGNSHQCLAPLPISTSKREQFLKPDIVRFLCLFTLKEPVRQALWEDMKRGIITPVPVGMLTDWSSTIVITAKKNGKPQRTIDCQHSQCKWETHYTRSPFQLSLQVPPKQKKTLLDAVNGYHSVPPDKESQPTNHLHHRMGKIHVPEDAIRLPCICRCLHPKVWWSNRHPPQSKNSRWHPTIRL